MSRKIVTRDKYFIETIDKMAAIKKQMDSLQKKVDDLAKPHKDRWNRLHIEHETIRINRMKAVQTYTDKELNDFETIVDLGKDEKKDNYYLEVVDEFEEWKNVRTEKIRQFEESQKESIKKIKEAEKELNKVEKK